MKKDFKEGLKLGIAIGIGYFCVSFAFGMMVKNASLPTWCAFLISATNLTSAGQFAGLNFCVICQNKSTQTLMPFHKALQTYRDKLFQKLQMAQIRT